MQHVKCEMRNDNHRQRMMDIHRMKHNNEEAKPLQGLGAQPTSAGDWGHGPHCAGFEGRSPRRCRGLGGAPLGMHGEFGGVQTIRKVQDFISVEVVGRCDREAHVERILLVYSKRCYKGIPLYRRHRM